jgi:prepilin-type N-terminal cleavage/methylation domain-containing protein
MRRRHRSSASGYTLIEMLIALIMFAVITVAVGFVLNGALRAYQTTQARIEESTELRALFGTLGRDLRAVFVVANSPNSYFIAPGNTNGTILTFTTLASRIVPDTTSVAAGPTGSSAFPQPQSDVWLVSYAFDQDTGVLSRFVTKVPNTDTIPQDETLLTEVARNVRSIQVTFPDPVNGDRSDWDYMLDTSATGAGSSDATASMSALTPDTTLPAVVQVTIVRDSKAGPPITQTFTVALMNNAPQPAGQKPAATAAGGGSGAPNALAPASASNAFGLPGQPGLPWPAF